MKVKVQFQGILSDWFGGPEAEIYLEEAGTFGDLLRKIKKSFAPTMPPQLRDKDQDTFNRSLWAMRGKERISNPAALLNEGDEVQFFLSLAGG